MRRPRARWSGGVSRPSVFRPDICQVDTDQTSVTRRHASIAITKDVYGHLLEGDKRAAAESMSRALFGGC